MDYNNLNSPNKIRNIELKNLFIIDIDRIKKEHESHKYKDNKIIKSQVLYYFLFKLLEQHQKNIITYNDLYKLLNDYFKYHKINCNNTTIAEICKLFINKNSKNKTDNFLTKQEFKNGYKQSILCNKYKIKEFLHINNIIELYGMLSHNYIFEEKISFKTKIINNYNNLKVYMINNKIYIIWLFIYFIINLYLFLWKFYKYKNNQEAFNLYGYSPAFSKGLAQICLFNTFLILLPLSFGLLRFLRKFELLRYYIPFDINIKFHKICGYVLLLAGLGHGIAHINTFFNKIQKLDNNTWINTTLYQKGALKNGRTFSNYTGSLPGWTGIILTLIFIIAIPFSFNCIKRKNFNLFWYSHYLFFPLYFILIIFHGANQWFEKTTAWMWAIGPFLLYSFERLYRYFKKSKISEFKIIEAKIKDNIIILKILKNQSFNNYLPSMYLFLNIPIISQVEWHPFTIVSNPSVNYITLYIENLGDWTNTLYNLVKDNHKISNIYIDGPINSPSENYLQYDISMMICGGIGITPFLSIIKDIILKIYNYRKLKMYNEKILNHKIYFYWCCRNQNLFNLCSKTLNEIIKLDFNNQIEINTYLTRIKKNIHFDILSNIQYICYELLNKDIISNLKGRNNLTKFNRPDFDKIFNNMVDKYEDKTIGIFFCGSVSFKKEIQKKCKKYSINEKNIKFKLHYEYF